VHLTYSIKYSWHHWSPPRGNFNCQVFDFQTYLIFLHSTYLFTFNLSFYIQPIFLHSTYLSTSTITTIIEDPQLINLSTPYASTSQQTPQPRGAQEAEEVAPPWVQFAYPDRDPRLPFPTLSSSPKGKSSNKGKRRSTDLLATTEDEDLIGPLTTDTNDSTPSSPEIKPQRMASALPVFGSSSTRSVLDMPLRGSKDASKTFRGHHSEIEYFIVHYDKLLVKFRVADPYDCCECVLDYCSTEVQGFIRASEYYQNRNWPELRRELLKCYDADRATSRYKPSDIAMYTLKTQWKPFHNLSQWKKYYITADVSTEGADRKFSVLGWFQRIPYISVSSSPIHIKTK
jgi:hypothetical protein